MSRAPYVHDWGAPNITRPPVAPPTHDGYPGRNPLPYHGLKFNPLGCFDLRCRLGIFQQDPSIWNTYRRHFQASDIAWLASGASEDNQHHPGSQGFFPEFKTLRNSLPANDDGQAARSEFEESVRKLIWDLATMWDRTFGSTTMILHVAGTTVPGSPAAPEYLRTAVYLPPRLPSPQPGEPRNNARNSMGWRLTQASGIIHPNSVPADLVIPSPKQPGSAHYIFRGRPARSAPTDGSTSSPPPASPTSTRYGSEEPLSDDALALLTAIERVAALEAEVALLHTHLEKTSEEQIGTIRELGQVQAQLAAATMREEGYRDERQQYQRHITSLQTQLGPVYAPPTYNAASQATPTRSRAGTPFSSPSKTPVAALPRTTEFLETHALSTQLAAIRMMIKHAPATKWYLELAGMDLDDTVAEGLLECLTIDCL
ncbi:hypothetical protein C8F04DRAFT_1280666 [Mycena alexandri]|uniref:Uncharacterized protein n=1 Tax=Mycena alexandri TaxID=1745969 RepID=A0AAD6WLD6_9AGAR|nr:hypothetical protein C8F04DRAFT_1280666 [Mycena alexandri]